MRFGITRRALVDASLFQGALANARAISRNDFQGKNEMRKTMYFSLLFAIAACVVALVGCSRAPGNAEVRDAIRARIVGLQMGPSNAKDEKIFDAILSKVELIGCKSADGNNGYNCDWTAPQDLALTVGNSGRVVKSDSGWVLAAPVR